MRKVLDIVPNTPRLLPARPKLVITWLRNLLEACFSAISVILVPVVRLWTIRVEIVTLVGWALGTNYLPPLPDRCLPLAPRQVLQSPPSVLLIIQLVPPKLLNSEMAQVWPMPFEFALFVTKLQEA